MELVNRLVLPALRISARHLSTSWLSSAPTTEHGSSQSSPKPFSEIPGNMCYVVVSTPEAIEEVYRSEGKNPSRGIFESNFEWIYSRKMKVPVSMALAPPDTWRHLRSAISQQMIPRRVRNYAEPLSGIADDLIRHLESIQDESGNVQDVSPELIKWAFKGIAYFVYSEKIEVFSGSDSIQKDFVKDTLDYLHSLQQVMFALPLYRIFPTKPYREFTRALKKVHERGREVLQHRIKVIKDDIMSGNVDESKAVGLLDQWLIEGKLSEDETVAQCYDMLAAGIDTTSNTAAFLLYELARHPEIQERLVQEISSVVGDKEHPSWEDVQKMTLLKNCVKEILRIYVPGDITFRVLDRSTELMGYQVPAGTNILLSNHAAARDSRWYKDPEDFEPDRWNKEISEKGHPFSSLPFAFGPRGCYGRRFAELELYILMTRLLPKYRLSTDIQHMKIVKKLVLQPNIPLHIKFSK